MTEDGPDPNTWLTLEDARALVARYCGSEASEETFLYRGVHNQRVRGQYRSARGWLNLSIWDPSGPVRYTFYWERGTAWREDPPRPTLFPPTGDQLLHDIRLHRGDIFRWLRGLGLMPSPSPPQAALAKTAEVLETVVATDHLTAATVVVAEVLETAVASDQPEAVVVAAQAIDGLTAAMPAPPTSSVPAAEPARKFEIEAEQAKPKPALRSRKKGIHATPQQHRGRIVFDALWPDGRVPEKHELTDGDLVKQVSRKYREMVQDPDSRLVSSSYGEPSPSTWLRLAGRKAMSSGRRRRPP